MRLLLGVTLIFAVAAFGPVGCGKPTTGKPGTPTGKPGSPVPSEGEKGSVKIEKIDDQSVKADTETKVKVTVDRTKYTHALTLKGDAGKGLEDVTIEGGTIAKDKDEGTIVIKAGKKAKGKGDVTVTASGEGLKTAASQVFKLEVSGGEVTPPKDKKVKYDIEDIKEVKVKQGDTAKVDYKAKGENVPEKLTVAGGDKKGVSVEGKADEKGGSLTVTAAKDAEVGDHEITVTITGEGLKSEAKLKVVVEKK